MNRIELLRRLKEIIPYVPPQELDKFIDICRFMAYPSKKVILEKDSLRRKAFLILKGSVRGYIINKEGKEKNILLRSEGIFVGDAATLFTGSPQRLIIESLNESEVLLFNFEDFERLAHSSPLIMELYLNSLKEAVLRLTYRIDSMITMTNEERYLDLLQMNPIFLKDAFDKHIANFLGITPVSLSRIKKRLKKPSN